MIPMGTGTQLFPIQIFARSLPQQGKKTRLLGKLYRERRHSARLEARDLAIVHKHFDKFMSALPIYWSIQKC